MTDALVSTDWLARRVDDSTVRVLDCRFDSDDVDKGRRVYVEAHIPGAQYLNWTRDISEPRGHLQSMAPSADHLRPALERLGISTDTTIVGYDDEGGHYASRLWLIMRRFGNDNVRVLEGGWTKWQAEGRAVRAGAEPAPARGTFSVGDERAGVLVEADEVLALRDDPNTALVDVRRLTEFTGEEVRAKHGGRIPWARWLLWQDNLNWAGQRDFKTAEEIKQRFEAAGITPDQQVITYCQGGVRAAHTALALERSGYRNVRVYDGSWEEWGSRDDLPIARGAPE